MRKRLISLVCLLLGVAAGALAQHWTVNPHEFQYDMTAYVSLKGYSTAQQLADFELAAFCNEECRGVGKVLTVGDGTSLFQLRIRSNVTSGETIIFSIYQKSEEKEYYTDSQLDFESQSVAGTPSEPLIMEVTGMAKKGDVNGDGAVDITDATIIVYYVLGRTSNLNLTVADINGDGEVDITDATIIVYRTLGRDTSSSSAGNTNMVDPQ